MDQYVESNESIIYLHANSTDPFVDLNSQPIIESTSPDILDISTYNSFYQRLLETETPSPSKRSANKSFDNSPVQMAPVSQINYPTHSNRINYLSSSKPKNIDYKTNSSKSISNSLFDQCISNEYPKVLLNKEEYIPISDSDNDDNNDNDLTTNYKLSSKKSNLS